MKLKTGILLIIFCLSIISNVFAVPPQTRTFGNTLVKTGTSTKNIMPLLTNIAEKWGQYLESIYGQYRVGYIIITMVPNKMNYDIEEMKNMVKDILNNVMSYYPGSEGRITLDVAEWDSIAFEFAEGQIYDKSIHIKRQ